MLGGHYRVYIQCTYPLEPPKKEPASHNEEITGESPIHLLRSEAVHCITTATGASILYTIYHGVTISRTVRLE